VSRRSSLFPLIAPLVIASALAATVAAQRKFDEREVKATFLFNFAQFVDWPGASFSSAQAPLVIGVLGVDPFGAILDAVVRGEAIRNRPLAVARFDRVEDVGVCHILFVSSSEEAQYERIAEALRGRAILTVGDSTGFASGGGMIRFITENNRIRLRINLAAARSAGLTISSQLLRAADVIGGGGLR
jgi:hypothetical protein